MSAVLEQSLPPPHRWIAAERASDVEITQAVAESTPPKCMRRCAGTPGRSSLSAWGFSEWLGSW